MGCKDDDTCDLPATKGEIENMMKIGGVAIFVLLASVYWVGDKVDKAEVRDMNNTLTVLQGMEGMKKSIMRR